MLISTGARRAVIVLVFLFAFNTKLRPITETLVRVIGTRARTIELRFAGGIESA